LAENQVNYNNNNTDNYSNPVTVIDKRIAKKDKIKEFEEWLSGFSKEVSRQYGSMGIDIIRPSNNSKSKSEYVIMFRLKYYDILKKGKNRPFEKSGYQKVMIWLNLTLRYKN